MNSDVSTGGCCWRPSVDMDNHTDSHAWQWMTSKVIRLIHETFSRNVQHMPFLSSLTAIFQVDLGYSGVLTPWKYVGGVRVCFDLIKMSLSFIHSKLLSDNSAIKFHIIKDERLVSKQKVKIIFRGAWNSLMAWPDWPDLHILSVPLNSTTGDPHSYHVGAIMSPFWILIAKDGGGGGDNWSYKQWCNQDFLGSTPERWA